MIPTTLSAPGRTPDAACLLFRGDTASIRDARAAARAFLVHHRASEDCTDSVLLVVSELVTNAVRHTGGPYTLRAAVRAGAIEIAVSDSDPTLPCARVPDLVDGTGGFGSSIVARLGRRVTVDRHRDGKTVRVTIDR